MIKYENKTKLMSLVAEVDGLKDKINEAIEFFLDKQYNTKNDELFIGMMEDKVADLRLLIEQVSFEFSLKL